MGRKISAGLALAAIVFAGLAWVPRLQAQSEAGAVAFAPREGGGVGVSPTSSSRPQAQSEAGAVAFAPREGGGVGVSPTSSSRPQAQSEAGAVAFASREGGGVGVSPTFSSRPQAQSEAWAVVFAHANRLYEEGRYEEAAAKYEEIVASGLKNGRVYYNLGNAYFKQEKLGLAILNYERAHRLMPRDEDIKTNLTYARSQIVDKIETPDPSLLGRWLASLQGLLTIDETTILTWALYLVMTILALLAVFVWRWRRFCLYALGFLSVLLILSLASLGVKLYQQEHVREAVVTAGQVDVLSGPGENYLLEFTVHEGTRLTVEEERGDWWRVRLWGDLEGWAQKAGLQEI